MKRSFLFTPGNQAKRVAKAFTFGADAVILDLEDSVAEQDKFAARKPVAEALAANQAYVRVNAMGTPWCYADLVEVVRPGLQGIVLPKVESAADLHAIDWLLANLERERGLAVGGIDLMPIIESAAGLARLDRVLQARGLKPYSGTWRVRRVAFGAADYARDLRLSPSADEPELEHARERLVLASRAVGMQAPIDSPWFRLGDAEGLGRAVERSRRSGFQGRLCIHPEQVAAANHGYAPRAEDLARAERIVAAFRAAEAKGIAAIQVDGQMVDYPIALQAEELLKVAKDRE